MDTANRLQDRACTSNDESQTKSTAYFVRLRSEVLRDRRLSDGAVRLYGLLLDHDLDQKGHSWPGEKYLGHILGRDERTIRNYVRELEAAGHLEVRRRRRQSSLYVFRTLAPRYHGGNQDRKPVSVQDTLDRKSNVDLDRKDSSAELRQDEQRQSSSAAAQEPSPKTAEAARELKQAGVSPKAADRFSTTDPTLALLVLAFWRWRISQGYQPDHQERVLCKWLADPEEAGFVKESGLWRPPPEFAKAQVAAHAAKEAAGTAARIQAAQREQLLRERQEAIQNAASIAAAVRAKREAKSQ